MKRSTLNKITAFLILFIIFHLLFSFIEMSFNPVQWGILSRLIYGIGFTITLIFFAIND